VFDRDVQELKWHARLAITVCVLMVSCVVASTVAMARTAVDFPLLPVTPTICGENFAN
jgi:hypothetical protein